MMKVYQRIPLARTLSIEFDFVVVPMQSMRCVEKGHDLMHKRFASTEWCLKSTNWPIQRSRLTCLDFFRRFGENFRCE